MMTLAHKFSLTRVARAFVTTNAPASPTHYDVLVIGGGDACTRATAAPRSAARVALLTHRLSSIGAMSCNPSIGGIGHLVRDLDALDALDGLMPRTAYAAAIQFRTLNSSWGPAVRGLRAQCDHAQYSVAVREYQYNHSAAASLTLLDRAAQSFILEAAGRVAGIHANLPAAGPAKLRAQAVVLTTGTFINGRLRFGSHAEPGGRRGAFSAINIATALRESGLRA